MDKSISVSDLTALLRQWRKRQRHSLMYYFTGLILYQKENKNYIYVIISSSLLFLFKKKDFFQAAWSIFIKKARLVVASFGSRRNKLNNLCRSQLDNAICQLSKLSVIRFRTFYKNPYTSVPQTNDPVERIIFGTRRIIWKPL